MQDALVGANLGDSLAPAKLQFHKLPFCVVNTKTQFGKKLKEIEQDEKFIQSLFTNYQIQHLSMEDIELGGKADKMDRWAYEILSQYADKAYAFIDPIMIPEKVGFEMIPYYFVYEPTLKRLSMKVGMATDIAATFSENGIEFTNEELQSSSKYVAMINAYLSNTPVVVVKIMQKLPLYEYPDIPWRFSVIKKDAATMQKLESYLASCKWEPREDRYYFIKSSVGTREDGRKFKSYHLVKEGRYKNVQQGEETGADNSRASTSGDEDSEA